MEPREVVFERTYDASLDKVWGAWTDPEQIKQWWGPAETSIPECEIDLKVGGRFYLVMEAGPGMGDYAGIRWPMESTYTSVEPKTGLAYSSKAWTEGDEAGTLIDQTNELSLSEDGGKTKMVLKVTVISSGPKAGAAIEGMKYGFGQQFDKLEAYLNK